MIQSLLNMYYWYVLASYVFKFPPYNLSTIVVPFYRRIIELKQIYYNLYNT